MARMNTRPEFDPMAFIRPPAPEPDRLRWRPIFVPPPEDDAVEIVDLDSPRLQIKPHTWG